MHCYHTIGIRVDKALLCISPNMFFLFILIQPIKSEAFEQVTCVVGMPTVCFKAIQSFQMLYEWLRKSNLCKANMGLQWLALPNDRFGEFCFPPNLCFKCLCVHSVCARVRASKHAHLLVCTCVWRGWDGRLIIVICESRVIET